jgi:serine/threonine protein kinase
MCCCFFETGRRLPLPLALKFAVDIAKGLVELHRLGVTAADLKPDNVLVDDELGDAVIADFGLSSLVMGSLAGSAAVRAQGSQRALMRSAAGPCHDVSDAVRGTPNYM